MRRISLLIKRIHAKDLLSPFIFLLMLIPSFIFRLVNKIRGRKLWLVAEHGEARDNGYHFYKYVRENHPSDYCFYAIKPDDAGFKKVSKLGNVIRYGSLKHWLYYMSANLNISSQKSGSPSPVFFGFIHTTLGLYKNRVFLQHGITKDDSAWLYFSRTKFKFFICGAEREYNYIKERFGYPEDAVLLTGFPRWDNLKDTSKNYKQKSILVMPTWRNWLGGENGSLFKTRDFEQTNYFKHWNGFLTDESFVRYIEKEDIKVYFYPHSGMQKYIKSFNAKSKNIEIVTLDHDIQEFFNKCNLMVTDYSSVAFDFAYLRKPVVYYQFDKEEYRSRQLAEGYYKYEKDGFGPVCNKISDLLKNIKLRDRKEYYAREDEFFCFRESENCKRVYEAIK